MKIITRKKLVAFGLLAVLANVTHGRAWVCEDGHIAAHPERWQNCADARTGERFTPTGARPRAGAAEQIPVERRAAGDIATAAVVKHYRGQGRTLSVAELRAKTSRAVACATKAQNDRATKSPASKLLKTCLATGDD